HAAFKELGEIVRKNGTGEVQLPFKCLLEDYGESALELLTYFYWMSQEPDSAVALLILALETEVKGTEEMVRRLAFTRTGEDPHRLGAAGALAMTGRIGEDEQVSLWLGARLLTGKLDEVLQKYKRQVEWQAELEDLKYPSDISAQMQKGVELIQENKTGE
ncbi:MAG: hypothetical protein HGA25_02255, partial [Clostridiales bacterium]|nr:hypothetical protein [Clostridiales bacterium]